MADYPEGRRRGRSVHEGRPSLPPDDDDDDPLGIIDRIDELPDLGLDADVVDTGLSNRLGAGRPLTRVLNKARSLTLAQLLFLFISPGAIAGAIWSFIFFWGEDGESATRTQVAVQAIPELSTTTRLSTTTLQTPATTLEALANQGEGASRMADLIPSIVFLNSYECEIGGSGTVVGDGRLVLTNAHVVRDGNTTCDTGVWFIDSDQETLCDYDEDGWFHMSDEPDAVGIVAEFDDDLDLAVLRLFNSSTLQPLNSGSRGHPPLKPWISKPEFGEPVYVLGWPGSGGCTITVTRGIYSGMDLTDEFEYYKTDATVNRGNSGGAAFDADGHFIGVPTAGTYAELECDDPGECSVEDIPYGLIRPIKYAIPMINRVDKTP